MGLKSRWAWVVAFALTLGASACGDTKHDDVGVSTGGNAGAGGSSGGAAGQSGVTGVDGFEQAVTQAFCARLFHCALANDDDIGSVTELGTEQRCVEKVAEIQDRDPRILDLRAKLASGAIHFASDKVSACLAESRSCAFEDRKYNLTRNGSACRAVFEGSVPLGGACQRYEECAGDARCVFDQTCPGQCVARAALGQPCDLIQDCDPSGGYVECRFDATAGASKCVKVAVATPVAAGQACTAVGADGQSVVPCADGLWCDLEANNATGMGICRAPLAAGAACDDADDLCVNGYTCFDQVSCKAGSISSHAGDPCDNEAGPYCDPFARLSCVSGKCQTLGDGSPGSACAPSDIHELLDCQAGLRCAGTSPNTTCAPLLALDAACQTYAECASGTCVNGKCAAAFCEL